MNEVKVKVILPNNSVTLNVGKAFKIPEYIPADNVSGNTLYLNNVSGSTDKNNVYTNNEFDLAPEMVLNGWDSRLYSTAGRTDFPIVNGATYVATSVFEADEMYWIVAINRGFRVEYWFEKTAAL